MADEVQIPVDQFIAESSASSVLRPEARLTGSPYPDVGLDGLFPVHGPGSPARKRGHVEALFEEHL